MLWPVLLNADPLAASWSLGERVSTRLRWLDHPDLPADLALRQVGVRASMLTGADGQPWAQLIEAGGLRAVRDGHHGAGHLTVDGCPGYDDFLRLIGELPVTVGIVRRVRVLHALHDRGTDGWIPRPGTLRFTDVPDASPERLRDDPDLDEPQAPQCEHEPGSMVWLSADEYYRLAYHQLPAEQWQGQGFLVDLDVPAGGVRGYAVAMTLGEGPVVDSRRHSTLDPGCLVPRAGTGCRPTPSAS